MPDEPNPHEQEHESGQPEPSENSGPSLEAKPEERSVAPERFGPAGEPVREVSGVERKRMNRRELLKLVPVVALGAFAVPKFQQGLLTEGLAFNDWASGKLFGRHHLAQTFSNREVAPLARFPYNYYDVLYPDVDL